MLTPHRDFNSKTAPSSSLENQGLVEHTDPLKACWGSNTVESQKPPPFRQQHCNFPFQACRTQWAPDGAVMLCFPVTSLFSSEQSQRMFAHCWATLMLWWSRWLSSLDLISLLLKTEFCSWIYTAALMPTLCKSRLAPQLIKLFN